MSRTLRIILIAMSIAVLVFAYWFYFSKGGHTWRANQAIEKSWSIEPLWKKEQKKEEEHKKEVYDERDSAESVPRLNSGSRNPIQLESKRNYVTGKNVTFIVPDNMRRMKLNIQERNGRNISSYSLPNSFISISAGQRINLVVE